MDTLPLSWASLSNAAQGAALTFNLHWWSLQNHSRVQMPNPLSGANKKKIFHRYLSTHDKKRLLCQHRGSWEKNKSGGRSEHGCGDCLFHSSSTEGGARWCKVTEDHSGVQVASSCHLYSVVLYSFQIFFVSKWSCLQLSLWMVEFIIKTLFSVLLRNQVLNCKWLILISMRTCITSTSVWKGNENMSWLEGKCILMCENEWWAFRQRNCFIQVKLEMRKCTKTANAGTLCRTHKRRQG